MATYYKYLSFGSDLNTIQEHTKMFFETSHLYMGTYKKLNDPMEAVYFFSGNAHDYVTEIKNEKSKLKIGCLSTNYTDVLMWSHYADGHKGCCVELEILENCEHCDIIYKPTIFHLPDSNSTPMDACIKILSHKLKIWRYEDEVRFFKESTTLETYLKVKIKKVWLGCALSKNEVAQRIAQLKELKIDTEIIQQFDKQELTFKAGSCRKRIFSYK